MGAFGTGIYGTGVYGVGGADSPAVPAGPAVRGTVTTVTAVGISVTVDTISMPPHVAVTVATPNGAAMTAVTITRTGFGLTAPTRVQPKAGFASRTLVDYEAPWETNLTYKATVVTATGTAVYTAPPVRLEPWAAWAIHPTSPALSVCIDQQDANQIGVYNIQSIARAATSTQHVIVGAARPIVTRIGSRSSSRGVLQLATVTGADENKVWSLVDDQTPLYIRFPTVWGANWEGGYYDIGDVTADRTIQWVQETRRIFALPYTRVDAPAGDQQSDWGYAQLLHDFADYPSVAAAFADYPAVLSNTRS